jgi:phosphoglycolate phosphatase-like HAD superfamily hydrolase
LYGLKWYEYFEHLLPDEPHEKHLELQALSFDLSDKNPALIARYMRPTANIIDVLQAIESSFHNQILISNTIPTAIPHFTKALGIENYFTVANAFPVNAHSKDAMNSKEAALDIYLQGKEYDDIIVIGDSMTDLRLAAHAKAKAYLYAHPGYDFRAEGGDYRINDLREVLVHL